MAHHYFKIPPHLAARVKMEDKEHKKLPDGNYMAFYSHMKQLCGTPYQIEEKCPSMGCLALDDWEMNQEISGKLNRPLPEPTDPKFFPPNKAVEAVIEEEEQEEEQHEAVAEILIAEETEDGQVEAVADIIVESEDNRSEEEGE